MYLLQVIHNFSHQTGISHQCLKPMTNFNHQIIPNIQSFMNQFGALIIGY